MSSISLHSKLKWSVEKKSLTYIRVKGEILKSECICVHVACVCMCLYMCNIFKNTNVKPASQKYHMAFLLLRFAWALAKELEPTQLRPLDHLCLPLCDPGKPILSLCVPALLCHLFVKKCYHQNTYLRIHKEEECKFDMLKM